MGERKKNRKKSAESGQALTEFVIIAITFLFVVLGLMQLAMVLNAQTLTKYAAYNAVRAAIVSSADQGLMEEAARLSLVGTFPRHGVADTRLGFSSNYLAAKAVDRLPAYADSLEPITSVRVTQPSGLPSGTVITFDDPAQADLAVITVQVVHNYELVIPLVNRILFFVYERFRRGESGRGESLDALSAQSNVLRTGRYRDIEYRIPLVAHYTMRLQSDYVVP